MTVAADRVRERERSARERLIPFIGSLVRAEGLATGRPSSLVHLAAALLPGACLVVPLELVERRENLRAIMFAGLPAAPDPLTLEAVVRLIGEIATGLSFSGAVSHSAHFARALADLVADQLIPPSPKETR